MSQGHPNTVAAASFGGVGTLTVYLLNTYAGTHLTSVDAGLIASGFAAAILFIGRRGVKGTAHAVWNGVWNGTPPGKATKT